MGTWVVVSADVIADDPELAEWVEQSLRGVRAAPPPKKPSRRETSVAVKPKRVAKKAAEEESRGQEAVGAPETRRETVAKKSSRRGPGR
jgi:hypothetical protein